MKWTHKGHEYDSVYSNMEKITKLFLFGAGERGIKVLDLLNTWLPGEFHIMGFIDNNPSKQYTKLKNLEVLPVDQAAEGMDEHTAIILCIYGASPVRGIDAQLQEYGYKKNKEYFHYTEFLSVYFAYKKSKLFFPDVSFLPLTNCNLKCEACLNFTPYIKKNVCRSMDKLIEEVDLFFSVVDYIDLFHVSGGEPQLYKDLPVLLAYISQNYGNRIHTLGTVTNGTIVPSEDFLKVYRDYPIMITVDDYRDAIPEISDTFEKVVQSLESVHGKGRYEVLKYDAWIDVMPRNRKITPLTDEQLINKYDACHVLLQEYRDGKMFTCNYGSYASVAGVIGEVPASDFYDLRSYNKSKLKELMEFRLGFSVNGYSDFCRQCAGLFDVNAVRVQPGKQVE